MDAWSESIRHVACTLVIPLSEKSVRCNKCTSFRGCLRVQSSRLQSRALRRTDPDSHVPYSVLSSDEMQARMKRLHSELRRIQKQRNRLRDRLDALVERHGVTVDEQTCGDLKEIIHSEGSKMLEKVECNSFQRMFWQQQVHAASKKDSRGMRWHPLMIKWCIYLRYLSRGAYETLRQSKCVALPSQRTLRDYTHHLKPGTHI